MVLHSTGCGRVGHRRTHIPENPQPPPVGGFLHPTPPTPTAPHPARPLRLTHAPARHRRAQNRQTRATSPPPPAPFRAQPANARAFAAPGIESSGLATRAPGPLGHHTTCAEPLDPPAQTRAKSSDARTIATPHDTNPRASDERARIRGPRDRIERTRNARTRAPRPSPHLRGTSRPSPRGTDARGIVRRAQHRHPTRHQSARVQQTRAHSRSRRQGGRDTRRTVSSTEPLDPHPAAQTRAESSDARTIATPHDTNPRASNKRARICGVGGSGCRGISLVYCDLLLWHSHRR